MTNKVDRRTTPDKQRKMAVKVTEERKLKFLETLAMSGNITSAAACHGLTVNSINTEKRKDAKFAEAIEIARGMALMELEDVARSRALHGIEKDVYFKGDVVGKEIQYDNKLLMFLMQAADKQTYGKNPASNISVTQNISTDESTLSKLSSFLKIDIHSDNALTSSSESRDEDIIDGEYYESTEE
jgi:hypothetical protein